MKKMMLVFIALLFAACAPTPASLQPTHTPWVVTPTRPDVTSTPWDVTPTANEPTMPAPTPTSEPVQSTGNQVSYEGVSFNLDSAIASGANGTVLPEQPGSPDGPYWNAYPEYVSITFDGYPLQGTQWHAQVQVYPVEDYARVSPEAAKQLDALKNFLAEKPAAADQIPFLPVVNAAQTFHAGLQYLDFQNGSGVRFLTLYAQYPAPVNNQDLFYTFQGLSADGKSFVSVVMPVNQPSLPASMNALSQSQLETIAQDYNQYSANMSAQIAALDPTSFTPDLTRLDALVQSLKIDR